MDLQHRFERRSRRLHLDERLSQSCIVETGSQCCQSRRSFGMVTAGVVGCENVVGDEQDGHRGSLGTGLDDPGR